MERRFVRAWRNVERRAEGKGGLPDALRRTPNPELVAALAGAGAEDPVAANAIATELLNRARRAPYLGAFIASISVAIVIPILEWLFTGSIRFDFNAGGRRGFVLMVLSLVAAVAFLGLYKRWMFLPANVRSLIEDRKRGY